MSTFTKSAIAFGVVAGIFGLVTFFGYSPFVKMVQTLGTSPQGTTSSTAKFFSVAVSLTSPGANATSSSIQNTSSNDYYISSLKSGCESVGTSQTAYTGLGLASLKVTVATTSTAAPSTWPAGTNVIGGSSLTIGTSTPNFGVSSSTIPGPTGVSTTSIIWAAGSYLTFMTNATNTAQCTFGVEAFSS